MGSKINMLCVIAHRLPLYPPTKINILCFIDHEWHQTRDPVRLADREQHDYSNERLRARGHGVCSVQYGGAGRERAHCHQRNLGRASCRNCGQNWYVFTHGFTHESTGSPNTKFTLIVNSIIIPSALINDHKCVLFFFILRCQCT